MEKSGSDVQARNIAQKKQESEIEEQRLQAELSRAGRERRKTLEVEREKSAQQLVEISQAANNQLDAAKKTNTDRVHSLNANTQKNFEALAVSTAEDIKRLDNQALKTIQDRKTSNMEKIRNVTDQNEDPFYRLKSLNPVLSEGEKDYTITVKLPEHEAKNLFISGEGPYVKISLARRFEDDLKNQEEKRTTHTNSYQSVVESVAMPGAYDAKKMERSYQDGVATIKIPKLVFGSTAKEKS